MQTSFTPAQLADPRTAGSERILRACVHCGFCTATCPTYLLLGDELDSPRGRIGLIKDLLEHDRAPAPETVTHIDRCLSCLSCKTTCPSGVDYMHLIDHGRHHIEKTYRRPWQDRWFRRALAAVLPYPARMRLVGLVGSLARPLLTRLPGEFRNVARLIPEFIPTPSAVDRPQRFPAEGKQRMRVVLLSGCVQQVLAPGINEATVRLLRRLGAEVVIAPGAGCCGAIPHHLGRTDEARAMVRRNLKAWTKLGGIDAIVANAAGCGTMLKDYASILDPGDPLQREAERLAALALDVSEVIDRLQPLVPLRGGLPAVAYHSACSLQHGQRVELPPRNLLRAVGFEVREVPEGHICCGSAGTYNLLQPELAGALLDRKLAAISTTGVGIVAAGNLGCIMQIASRGTVRTVHTVELLDWATGGPMPTALETGLGPTLTDQERQGERRDPA